MDALQNLFYPFFQSPNINPLKYIELKWVSVKIFIIVLLSYLLGAYKGFIIVFPLYILITIYFTLIIVLKNKDFFTKSQFGEPVYINLPLAEKEKIYDTHPEKIKIISWVLWIIHIIPLILFFIWLDKIRKGYVNIGSDDPWLVIRKNNLLIAMLTIICGLLFLYLIPHGLYGVDGSYYILGMPVLLLAITMLLY
jgi:hypothetical protein